MLCLTEKWLPDSTRAKEQGFARDIACPHGRNKEREKERQDQEHGRRKVNYPEAQGCEIKGDGRTAATDIPLQIGSKHSHCNCPDGDL